MTRRSTLGLALLTVTALAAGSASRAAPPAASDPAGTWHLKFAARPGETTLKIEKSGDRYVGVLAGGRGRSAPIKDAQFKDGELSFQMIFDRQGQKITMTYTARVTGDKMKGKMAISLFRNRSFDFVGTRAKEEEALAGSWKINMTLESGQKLQPTLRLEEKNGKLRGLYVGVSGKEARIPSVTYHDREVSFQVPDQFDEEKAQFAFTGKVSGDSIRGTVQLKSATQTVSRKFEAERVKTPTADVAGTWKLRVALKDGPTFEPTLKVQQQGSGVTGTYIGEQGSTPIADALIFGNELTFDVVRERDGKKYRLHYQGKVKGDAIKGFVDYDFDGMNGFVDFDGRRIPGSGAADGKKQ